MAGASMKDIKLRIRSVESTMQITKAMQLVATSKLRRAKERMENSKPYTRISTAALAAAVACCDDPSVPYVTPRGGKGRCYVLIAGDRGLAGGYNANLFKAFSAHAEGADSCVLPLGRKAIERCHRLGLATLTDDYSRVEGTSVGTCYHLARLLLDGYDTERYDELWLVYTNFVSMMTQEVVIEQLLPVQRPPEGMPHTLVSTCMSCPPPKRWPTCCPIFWPAGSTAPCATPLPARWRRGAAPWIPPPKTPER